MALFPAALPEFFIKLLTDESDVVLDFFAGSNTTGFVAESLHRRWLALENVEEYLNASKFRFEGTRNTSSSANEIWPTILVPLSKKWICPTDREM